MNHHHTNMANLTNEIFISAMACGACWEMANNAKTLFAKVLLRGASTLSAAMSLGFTMMQYAHFAIR